MIAGDIAGIAMVQYSDGVCTEQFCGCHHCDSGTAAARFRRFIVKMMDELFAIECFNIMNEDVIKIFCLLICMIMRKIGARNEKRMFSRKNMSKFFTEMETILFPLITHDDRQETERGKHTL